MIQFLHSENSTILLRQKFVDEKMIRTSLLLKFPGRFSGAVLGEGEGHPFGWQTFTHMNSVQWCSLLQVQETKSDGRYECNGSC